VNTKTQQPVVIKQFQFAQLGAKWGEYDAIEQEMKVLRRLKHPSIPRYLNFFQTAGGFCMVQEYKDAESAANSRSFSPQEIKKVAISVLRILVYLQSRKPLVIHRDIKPENILIDGKMNVYLVDFGFARMGGGEVAASSVVKGSLGFMPPEQLFNRQLTEASDLYGLGATLICLLTGTKSADIGNLIDERYGIHFQHLVPPQERGWLNWLEKMVEPRPQDRYANAAEALAALKPLDVSRLPKVRLTLDKVELEAVELGEKLRQTITVSNPIPETVLSGRWEVAPHASDPPHTPYDHAWISFEPVKFESNEAVCQMTVDTSQLLAGETYTRQVVLRTNSQPETYLIPIEVKTAPLPTGGKRLFLFVRWLGFMLFFLFAGWLLVGLMNFSIAEPHPLAIIFSLPALLPGFLAAEQTMIAKATGAEVNGVVVTLLAALGSTLAFWAFIGQPITIWTTALQLVGSATGAFLGSLIGAVINNRWILSIAVDNSRSVAITMGVAFLGVFILLPLYGWGEQALVFGPLFSLFAWLSIGWKFAFERIVKSRFKGDSKRKIYDKEAVCVAFLSIGFSISLGAAFQLLLNLGAQQKFVEPLEMAIGAGMAIAGLAATAIPLLSLSFKRSRMIAKYRKPDPTLIRP
jgi:serine/threonine protein kinase